MTCTAPSPLPQAGPGWAVEPPTPGRTRAGRTSPAARYGGGIIHIRSMSMWGRGQDNFDIYQIQAFFGSIV